MTRETPEAADYISHYLPALRAHLDAASLPRAQAVLKKGQVLVLGG